MKDFKYWLPKEGDTATIRFLPTTDSNMSVEVEKPSMFVDECPACEYLKTVVPEHMHAFPLSTKKQVFPAYRDGEPVWISMKEEVYKRIVDKITPKTRVERFKLWIKNIIAKIEDFCDHPFPH